MLPNDPKDELQEKINQEIYKQNFELSIRNKTLSTLRALYAITTSSTGVLETAQKLVDSITKELSVAMVKISLVDKENGVLRAVGEPELVIPLNFQSNLAIVTLNTQENKITGNLFDVLTPAVSQEEADKIAKTTGVKTTLVYPLVLAGSGLGVLTIGFAKKEQDLSRAEHETLEQLVSVVAIALDRAKLFEDLQQANARLHDLDLLKSEFVSVASHELRTPMTAIKSYLWMAIAGRGGNITDKQKYYLERAYVSTDRLIKLVNDLLNVSRIESGKLAVDMQKVELPNFINEVIAEVKPRADEMGINIVNDAGALTSLPPVLADSDKIKEVVINLVGNSIKFSKQGGEVKIWCDTAPGFVSVHVTDCGEGVDPLDLPKLFQKFGLVKESYVTNQNATQGTGLGLYISKSIVELHGGTIKAESEGKEKGATFSFTLPIYTEEGFNEAQKHKGTAGLGIIHSTLD